MKSDRTGGHCAAIARSFRWVLYREAVNLQQPRDTCVQTEAVLICLPRLLAIALPEVRIVVDVYEDLDESAEVGWREERSVSSG